MEEIIMEKIIKITGTGKVSAKPDLIGLAISFESKDKDYEKAMSNTKVQIEKIRDAIIEAGFKKEDLKTTDFRVREDYSYVINVRRFEGYVCFHRLALEFDFDMERLGKSLAALVKSGVNPMFSISFTVKDKEKVKEELLCVAVENAFRKANILTTAAKVKLGELFSINYSWGEINMYSRTTYEYECDDMLGDSLQIDDAGSIDIEPDDIDVEDTVTIVWGLE